MLNGTAIQVVPLALGKDGPWLCRLEEIVRDTSGRRVRRYGVWRGREEGDDLLIFGYNPDPKLYTQLLTSAEMVTCKAQELYPNMPISQIYLCFGFKPSDSNPDKEEYFWAMLEEAVADAMIATKQ